MISHRDTDPAGKAVGPHHTAHHAFFLPEGDATTFAVEVRYPSAEVRDHVLIEDDIAPITASLTPIPAKTRTLVTRDYRYTRNSKREEQLFDLRADPDEMDDLKDQAPASRGLMIERLADALIEADDAARGAPAA